MKRSIGVTLLTVLLGACAGAGSSSSSASVPTQAGSASQAPPSVPATGAPATASTATASAAAVSASPAARGEFTLCASPTTADTCPLPPGPYKADIHDAYTLTITDPGWQEERFATPEEDEPTVILSRSDAPDQKLSIDTGQTSGLLDDAGVAALLADVGTLTMGPPRTAQVGAATGLQVDVAPTEARDVRVPGAGTYTLTPGHRYRLMALQFPMGQESGIKVIILDAPTATFDTFAPLADKVLQSLKFS